MKSQYCRPWPGFSDPCSGLTFSGRIAGKTPRLIASYNLLKEVRITAVAIKSRQAAVLGSFCSGVKECGTKREQSANKVRTKREQSANKFRTKCEQSANKLRTKCEQSANKVRTKREQSANKVRAKCEQSAKKARTKFEQIANKVRKKCEQIFCFRKSSTTIFLTVPLPMFSSSASILSER